MTTAVAVPAVKSSRKVVSRAAERYLSRKQGTAVPRYPSIYIFVNPTSGGNKAAELMKLGMEKMSFQETGLEADVSIFDIREGASGEKPAFMQLRELLDSPQGPVLGDYLRVVVAGGDGTVMWVLQELILHGINTDRVCIGIIPFGTGNDFSRATGWGASAPSDFPGSRLTGFRTWLKRWLSADVKKFDIWKVGVKLHDDGGVIYQLKNGEKVPLTEGNATDRPLKTLTKPMCNYFSTGVESRLGLGFDRNRKKSQFANKLVYGVEGTKKMLFKKTAKINQTMDKVVSLSSDGSDDLVFQTSSSSDDKYIQGDPVSLIAVNIPSFASGCDVWGMAKKIALKGQDKSILGSSQDMGDGMIELVSYNSLMGIGMEQSHVYPLAGNGHRVHQGHGPIEMDFKSDLSKDTRIYFQIDGEFYTCRRPEKITISHKQCIRVMKGPPLKGLFKVLHIVLLVALLSAVPLPVLQCKATAEASTVNTTVIGRTDNVEPHRQASKRDQQAVPHIPSNRTYIFVNPKSGGRKAGDILHLPNPYVYKGIA
ncbi:hypothetical protein FOZ62_028833, partial [Perkinsus olseni]